MRDLSMLGNCFVSSVISRAAGACIRVSADTWQASGHQLPASRPSAFGIQVCCTCRMHLPTMSVRLTK